MFGKDLKGGARSRAKSYALITTALGGFSALAAGAPAAMAQEAQRAAPQSRATIEEVVVTAQRREQALQDVPIAVSAFNAEALEVRQIDTFGDLQFNTPNVYFTKTFFSGSNFQIRGIGVSSTAASGDTGVGIHYNDVYVQQPRLFETEYYDLERVEVLRGPQGTLFGRNATGGTVNMITKRAQVGTFEGDLAVQIGNYDHRRYTGAINIPLGDRAAFRLSGIQLKRDGFTETVDPNANFKNYDGRDQYSVRASLRVEPTDRLTIDVIGSIFREDDDRVRTAKALCDTDPTGVLGCLPTGLGFGSGNFSATFGGIVLSDRTLGPLGLFPFNGVQGSPNPPDLRKVFADERPQYSADEDFLMLSAKYDFANNLSASLLVAKQESNVSSTQSGSPIGGGTVRVPTALLGLLLPRNTAALLADGRIPVSGPDPNAHAGSLGGVIQRRTNGIFSSDQSDGGAEQTTVEFKIQSDFEGRFNFLLGVNAFDYKSYADYYVFSSSLDYFAIVAPAALVPPDGGIDPITRLPRADPQDGLGLNVPYFFSNTDDYSLKSQAIFGEAYLNLRDDLKLTVGLRYTKDDKSLKDRSLPLIAGTLVPIGAGARSASEAYLLTGFDADPQRAGQQPFRQAETSFEEVTGRAVLDWKPDLSFTEDTLLYASYSRGYKGGGFNPPLSPVLFTAGVSPTFDPEFVNAFEVGTKNTIFGGQAQLNMTGFYYDYKGYQIGRGVARTVVNENVDAKIYGAEVETLWAPTRELQFNATLSYLKTEIKDARSVYVRDLTAGQPGHVIVKDLNGENCVVNNITPANFRTVTALIPGAPLGAAGVTPVAIPGLQSPGAVVAPLTCNNLRDAVAGIAPLIGSASSRVTDGIEVDLSGNSLPLSPEFSVSVGAQYSREFGNGFSIIARTDYRWQDKVWATLFNDPRVDQIDSWKTWNAQATLYGPGERYYVRGYVQNILDDDNITFHSGPSASTGLGTAVALQDPRIYGLELGLKF